MQSLINKAIEVMDNAYAPYSKFKVGCCIEMNDGNYFLGVNVENVSYGGTICAERNAINSAITSGYQRGDFKAIAVVATSKEFVKPCFICRQSFIEFFEDDMDIALGNQAGEFCTIKVAELMPYKFEEF